MKHTEEKKNHLFENNPKIPLFFKAAEKERKKGHTANPTKRSWKEKHVVRQ